MPVRILTHVRNLAGSLLPLRHGFHGTARSPHCAFREIHADLCLAFRACYVNGKQTYFIRMTETFRTAKSIKNARTALVFYFINLIQIGH